MRLPRIILNPAVGVWIKLWQRERRENARLRYELTEWQNKLLQTKNITPLFQLPPRTEVVKRPPIGPTAKRAYLADEAAEREQNNPTAEQVLGLQ